MYIKLFEAAPCSNHEDLHPHQDLQQNKDPAVPAAQEQRKQGRA